jgi:hypothetical protein
VNKIFSKSLILFLTILKELLVDSLEREVLFLVPLIGNDPDCKLPSLVVYNLQAGK